MLDFVLLILCSIIVIFAFIKILKWGIKCYSDDEIMDNFGLKEIFFPLLFLFWSILIGKGIYNIIFNRNKIFTPEILNGISEIEVNVEALIKNLPVLIIMLLVIIFIILIIPIICLIYYQKHKKHLKKENIKDFKKVGRTHFFMGLTAPVFFPLFLGPKMILNLFSSSNNTNKRFTKSYTKITDSKGNTTYIDTIIDNETGYGSTKVEDSKGNKSYHTTSRD